MRVELGNEISQISSERTLLRHELEGIGKENENLVNNAGSLKNEHEALMEKISFLENDKKGQREHTELIWKEKIALESEYQKLENQTSTTILNSKYELSKLRETCQGLESDKRRIQENLDTAQESLGFRESESDLKQTSIAALTTQVRD